jgi:LysR family nod box-dependent transcriptional activator
VPLLERLATTAPNVCVDIGAPSPQAAEQLDRGEVDFVLAPEQFLSAEHPTKLLLAERFVVVGWKGNPVFRRPLTEEAFFAHGHISVAMINTPSFAEQALAALGGKRRIEVTAPSFLTVPWMLPNTMRLSVMHERLAKVVVKRLPLAMAPMPFTFPMMREMIQHHGARGSDGGVQWLLQQIEASAALERLEFRK